MRQEGRWWPWPWQRHRPQPRAAGAAPPRRRKMVAKVLFVLGCAAAGLVALALGGSLAPTDADAAAEQLLLLAAAQVLASTVAVLVPERTVPALFACASAGLTGGHVATFLHVLADCNGGLHGQLLAWYIFFIVTLFAALIAAIVASFKGD